MIENQPQENNSVVSITETRTLETDIIGFASKLPYWAQFISEKLLAGEVLNEDAYDQAYHLLLQDADLEKIDKNRPDINIVCNNSSNGYKDNVLLTKVSQIEGINALVSGQSIEFSENLTIIYGSNGSGKSGYIRLFNNVFITKGEKKILPNIHLDNAVEKKAIFHFKSAEEYPLEYPTDCSNTEFKQFSVFDEKAVDAHLNNKNQFEFRPAGLMYFSELSEAYKQIDDRISKDIQDHSQNYNLEAIFDGESVIKNIITQLSAKTKIEVFNDYRPFLDSDKTDRIKLEEKKAILMALKKDKEIIELGQQKNLLSGLKAGLLKGNRFFTTEQLTKAREKVSECLNKKRLASQNSITQFQTNKLAGIGSKEWRDFIVASDQFARLQHPEKQPYPIIGDPCILCHQPLNHEATELVSAYWKFVKSKAEQDSIDAQKELETAITAIAALDLNLLPDSSILYKWLFDNRPEALKSIKGDLEKLLSIKQQLLDNLKERKLDPIIEFQANILILDEISIEIDDQIKNLQESDVSKEIAELQHKITFINHKEKLNDHFTKVEGLIADALWVDKANKGKKSINKRDLTNKEKELSGTYFNQAYIDHFNNECQAMNGNFGINIIHSGSAGTSYRQLNLKGKQPTDILSEGEQKVISIADFLSETILSGVNRGIIFDDPVTSLDEERKAQIADRLVRESSLRQVIIFTHDLVFVSQLIGICKDLGKEHLCHWIEQRNGKPGYISLKNSPSYEKEYKNADKPRNYYQIAKKDDCSASMREMYIQHGFTSLRTCYETLVIFGFFNGVVQRFVERVSIDSMDKVVIDQNLKEEMMESFGLCCRYMEGHTHSDKFAYKKPKLEDLEAEIKRYDELRIKIKNSSKSN